ncbi:MAG: CBS domain-containing protein [Bacteroidota bacterium]
MGESIAKTNRDASESAAFVKHLIEDIEVLEKLLADQRFEDDVVRIGAEQELCIIDEDCRPIGINLALLESIKDEHFTTELANYNLEINLDPFELRADCFVKVETQLRQLLQKAQEHADPYEAHLLLAGILPTIGKKEVSLDHLTPIPRYRALNEMLMAFKGGDVNLKIRGVDELFMKHDSVMFEACNTSFQLHLQIPSYDFVQSYNWAQAIAGPVLSICCNAPLLMGRELWQETRIALFQQSLDTRKTTSALRNQTPRVGFGDHWEKGNVAEIFKQDISKHRILLTKPIARSSWEVLEQGGIPKLPALSLHNGTVYRWNRPCYGISKNKPHLRIENRYIPSGPSVIDQMANFAFWVGLMKGRPKQFDDMPSCMDFKAVKTNFIKAARTGMDTLFSWCGNPYSAKALVKEVLLPIAYKGLENCSVDQDDIQHLLGIIAARIEGKTGAQWQIENFRKLQQKFKTDKSLVLLTHSMVNNQSKSLPVHEWDTVQLQGIKPPLLVKEIMTTHLLRLSPEDYLSMAQVIMEWNEVSQLPVENNKGQLVGLLPLQQLRQGLEQVDLNTTKVSDFMITDMVSISPEATITTLKKLLETRGMDALPVVSGQTLVGIVSKTDILQLS